MIPENYTNSYVPTNILLPEDTEEMRRFLTDILDRVSDGINDREIGQYDLQELVTGQKWFVAGDPQSIRTPFRKVVNFGQLPNNATKTVAHGITTNANTTFTRISGTATDPGATSITRAIPLPYSDPNTLANAIELYVDATNVTVVTGANYLAYTQCYIVLEYLQN